MKKYVKMVLRVLGILCLCFVLFVFNAFFGNPLSHLLAKTAAEAYLKANYSGMDLEINKVGYNFKNTGYYVYVVSKTSIDTHFSLYYNGWGYLEYDGYSNVTQKHNTYTRIDGEYRDLVASVFSRADFPYPSDIDYGELTVAHKEDGWGEINGINRDELEIDKIYDIRALGEKYGRLVFYADDENVTLERAAEILLGLKRIFTENNVPFYSIDFTLQKPKNEDGSRGEEAIYIHDFLYADIYEKDLTIRVAEAYNRLSEYYKELDNEKE